MNEINSILLVLAGILGIFSTIQLIRTRKVELKQKTLDLKQKQLEIDKIEAEKNRDALEIKREKDLDNKLETKVKILHTENEAMKGILNDISTKIEETNKLLTEHISENSLTKEFLQVYRFTVSNILHFWITGNAKYKQILSTWTDMIERYALKYIEFKSSKPITYEEFLPDEIMARMIYDFNKLADDLIDERINKQPFGKWLDAKNIHGKSRALANDLVQNGLTPEQLRNKFKTYIFSFATLYTDSVVLWMNLIEKNNNINAA